MFGYPFNKPRAKSPLFPLRIGLWNSLCILCLLFKFMHVGKAVLVVICTDHRLWICLSQGRDTIYLLLSIKLHVVIVCGKKNLWIRLLLVEWNKPSMTELTPGSGWRFNILDLYKRGKMNEHEIFICSHCMRVTATACRWWAGAAKMAKLSFLR